MLSCGDTESGEYSVYAGFRESNDLINTRKGKQNSVRMNVNIVECAFYVRRLLPDTESKICKFMRHSKKVVI
jgi:hypothetical protein